jgi:carbamoyl-phosphate synthase/aspartate carbamoyltransferase/dihydroorotase
MALNPRRIFSLPQQPDTTVEVDPDAEVILADERLFTKCGWTPFAGRRVYGRVLRVVLRGTVAYDPERGIMAAPGSGQVLP